MLAVSLLVFTTMAGVAAGPPASPTSRSASRPGGSRFVAWERSKAVWGAGTEGGRAAEGRARSASSDPNGVHNNFILLVGQQRLSDPDAESQTTTNADIAMDLANTAHLVGTYQEGQFDDGGALDADFTTSLDDGKTWTNGNLGGLTTATGGLYARAGNPRVVFGLNGAVYIVSQVIDPATCGSGLGLNRSFDSGQTWGTAHFIDQQTSCGVLDDMPGIAVDTFPASPFFGRIYVAWDEIAGSGQPLELISSDNGGVTWSAPVQVTPDGVKAIAPTPMVQPNGNLTIYYSQPSARLETVQTSSNGGASFAAPVVVHDFVSTEMPGMFTGNALGIGDAAVDPTTGNLFVLWADTRYDKWHLNGIMMETSTDGGQTWRGPSLLSGATDNPIDRATPGVGAYGGFVAATWFHRYDDPTGGIHLNRGFTFSADAGATWSKVRMIGCHKRNLSIDVPDAATVGGQAFLGVYQSVLTTPAEGHPLWTVSLPPKTDPHLQGTWTATMEYVFAGSAKPASGGGC